MIDKLVIPEDASKDNEDINPEQSERKLVDWDTEDNNDVSNDEQLVDPDTNEEDSSEIGLDNQIEDNSKEDQATSDNIVNDHLSDLNSLGKQYSAGSKPSENNPKENVESTIEQTTEKHELVDSAVIDEPQETSSSDEESVEKEFQWDDKPTSFLDENQLYMNMYENILQMKNTCKKMIENDKSSQEMAKATELLDSIIQSIISEPIQEETYIDEDTELL